MDKEPQVELLECTLRDGSYAVDFKFTETDTLLLVDLLAKLNFRWIEIGHGMGLGADQSGNSKMPASDVEIIRAAKQVCGKARIGAFCIAGLAPLESLSSAREAGLDFIRIGVNATEAHRAFPYLETSRRLGLIPCVNFMKSYAVTPEQFAQAAKQAVGAGAEVIYCVDSAGSMLPADVAAYFRALRDASDCPMGFHAHNNLQLAVANAIEAYRHGARFIDTTLYGIGRSAGNVPTEVAVAIFEKMSVRTGIDLFDVMDIAEKYVSPLAENIQMYDMLSVAMGFGRLHSSFLPKVKAMARKHHVDLRRLVVAAGQQFPVEVVDSSLEGLARGMPQAREQAPERALILFPSTKISASSLNSCFQDVKSLIDGMSITCAKRRVKPVLEMVATRAPAQDLVLSELVTEDDDMILGRVHFGSYEILKQVIESVHQEIALFLFDMDGGSWAETLPHELFRQIGASRITFIKSRSLLESYLIDHLALAAHRFGKSSVLFYGNPSANLVHHAGSLYQQVFLFGRGPVPDAKGAAPITVLKNLSDPELPEGGIDVILCFSPPGVADEERIGALLSQKGALLSLSQTARLEVSESLRGRTVISLQGRHAYQGQLSRWLGQNRDLVSSP